MGLSTLHLAAVRLRRQWLLAAAQALGLMAATELADRVIHMEDGVLSPATAPPASAGIR
jgi:hypothetical protein